MKYLIAFINAILFTLNRRKVNFIIVGAQKAGTTALDSYLRKHSQICMSDRKETHFFDRNIFFKGVSNYFCISRKLFSKKKSKLNWRSNTFLFLFKLEYWTYLEIQPRNENYIDITKSNRESIFTLEYGNTT